MPIENDRYTDTNGYILVYKPQHRKAMLSGAFQGYVYEHVLMAEEVIDRGIREGEVVHHLDSNRSNNSPDNLLVLSGPMHAKLHSWMRKHEITPNDKQKERNALGCIRCPECQKPVIPDLKFCSNACHNESRKRETKKPSKEQLEAIVWTKPCVEIAKDLGVSDSIITRWCKQSGVEKPPRGYWTGKSSDQNK
jgi:HNH endonuclease